ncbi:fumarylacetoacetate hydrolase family protein [Nocardioides fonticola]|uniref:Fumarylacetoacetate hydrolase family protein n=1 Tax=Nocardioides fonticola TaxID=450363 RepID=A0ABP7XDZ4_9ACTN
MAPISSTSPTTEASAGSSAVSAAARRLQDAARSGRPCAPVRDLIGPEDGAAAYAVQADLARARVAAGARIIGRKIGLTSAAVQAQLGVDQPDFGVLLDDMEVAHGGTVPPGRLLQPRIEAEIAFLLGTDLDGAVEELTDERVRGAVVGACAALEIVDSRIAGWDITFADTVADNGSSGLFVLGPRRVALAEVDPRAVVMTLQEDGVAVSHGRGEACLGDPLLALAWLARTAAGHGDPLRAGDVVLSGALGPMVPLRTGARYRASISGLGDVEVTA